MKFDFTSCGLTTNEIQSHAKNLTSYTNRLKKIVDSHQYSEPECSINLSLDQNLLSDVCSIADTLRSAKLKYIFVIGIGGSNLGTKAVYDALRGFYDVLESTRFPKMVFLDTQDQDILMRVDDMIQTLSSPDQVLINVISKSGSTTETAANAEVVYQQLMNKFGDVKGRFVFTTDSGSKMDTIASSHKIASLHIPKMVGGRFSVLSAVGLLPFIAAGLDVTLLRKGAQDMIRECIHGTNPAMISAVALYMNCKKGFTINDNFIFAPQLESLGKWYRQLMGESIGKNGVGITPTVSIGSTDLHSVGQLYFGGPRDKYTTFISRNNNSLVSVPEKQEFELVESISGKTIARVMSAIVEGTMNAYRKESLPFSHIVFEQTNEYELGQFMQFKMIEMMYLGQLFKVNAFDQPHVELYKKETKAILTSYDGA